MPDRFDIRAVMSRNRTAPGLVFPRLAQCGRELLLLLFPARLFGPRSPLECCALRLDAGLVVMFSFGFFENLPRFRRNVPRFFDVVVLLQPGHLLTRGISD
jgi:hypothetical protein